jgi:hypothetical protein
MPKSLKHAASLLVLLPLLVGGCGDSGPPDDRIPAGVSVDPPRRAPETGSMAVPGDDPATREQTGAGQPVITDTVSPPVDPAP